MATHRSRRRFLGNLAHLAGATCVALAGLPRTVAAAGTLSVRAELRGSRIAVGEAVDLVVEIRREGDGSDLPLPLLPDLAAQGFIVEGPASSVRTQTSWVNGRSSSSMRAAHTYTLIPSRPGRFELAVAAKEGDQTIRAPSIPVLEVYGEALPTEPTTPAASAKPTEASGDVFLWATVDKPTLYVGEQLTYELEVYERLRFANIHLRELPSFVDFWSEELPEGRVRSESVGGVGYRVHPGLRRALFPQRAGSLTITAAQVGVGLRRRISGPALAVEVLPLPAKGRPPGFSANNVGEYTITASVDREEVKVGEPLTLTVTIQGTGNLKTLDPGEWPDLEDMRRYDPKVDLEALRGDVVGGRRRYNFLIIPDRAGELTIPPHTLAFFNPEKAAYESVTTAPITIRARGEDRDNAAPASRIAATPPPTTADDDDLLLAPIVDVDALPRAPRRESWLTPGRWLAGMAGAPAVAGLIGLGRVISRHLAGDAASRARSARRERERALLAQAEAALPSGDDFYPPLAQLLQALAVDCAGPEGQGLARAPLLQLLADRGIPEAELGRLRDLLDRCDAARFGALSDGDDTAETRRGLLQATRDLLRGSALAKGRWG